MWFVLKKIFKLSLIIKENLRIVQKIQFLYNMGCSRPCSKINAMLKYDRCVTYGFYSISHDGLFCFIQGWEQKRKNKELSFWRKHDEKI